MPITDSNKKDLTLTIKTKVRGTASITYPDGVFKTSQELLNYLSKNKQALYMVYLKGSSVYLVVSIGDIQADYLIGSIHPKYSNYLNGTHYTEIISYIITGGGILNPSEAPDIFNKKKYGFNMEIIVTPRITGDQH